MTTPKESHAEQQDYSCDSDAVSCDRTAKLLSVGNKYSEPDDDHCEDNRTQNDDK